LGATLAEDCQGPVRAVDSSSAELSISWSVIGLGEVEATRDHQEPQLLIVESKSTTQSATKSQSHRLSARLRSADHKSFARPMRKRPTHSQVVQRSRE
jgi:hypothetical protein